MLLFAHGKRVNLQLRDVFSPDRSEQPFPATLKLSKEGQNELKQDRTYAN